MTHLHALDSYVLSVLPQKLSGSFILDVGCGRGEWGSLLRARKESFHLVGVDIWRPHLRRLCKRRVYDELIQIKAPNLPFKDKSFDISLACEVLEHLDKDDGYELLKELERVSRKMIVVSTPMNWFQMEIYGNPYERHVSEWRPQEFTSLGFKVMTVSFMSGLQGPKILSKVIMRFLYRFPQADLIIAYKTFR
jgi:ubiquinone/menaquinone biosynthesis C-methylase UbiE